MKNYLAIDTSGASLTVVAVKDGKTYERFIQDCAMKHSVTLMNEIDDLLTKEGLAAADYVCRKAVAAVLIAGEDVGDEARAVMYRSLRSIAGRIKSIANDGIPEGHPCS